MSTTAAMRSASGEMPTACTIAVRARVKTVKLATNPATTPNGRALPPPTLPDSTIGSTGRMQGESIVITPETKAKARSTAMDRSSAAPRLHRRTIPSTPPPFQIASLVPFASIRT